MQTVAEMLNDYVRLRDRAIELAIKRGADDPEVEAARSGLRALRAALDAQGVTVPRAPVDEPVENP